MSTVAIAEAAKAVVSGGLEDEMERRGLDDGEGLDEAVVVAAVAEAEAEEEMGGGENRVAMAVSIMRETLSL